MPASILGFVYSSERVKKRAVEMYEKGRKLQGVSRSRLRGVERRDAGDGIGFEVGMGYSRRADGKERWGVEVDIVTDANEKRQDRS